MDERLIEDGADWGLIRAFIEVVRTGTLSAAARNLGQTQPTLGRQIRKLEALCGEPLFLRTGRELAPTDRARSLYEAAGEIETEVTALARAFAAGARGSGVVRITAAEVFAVHVLPGLIAPILAADPELEIEVLASDRVDNLVRRDADIALRFARPAQPELIAVKIEDMPLGLYVSRSLAASRPPPRSLPELSEWPWVSPRTRTTMVDRAAALGVMLDRSRLRVRSDSMLVLYGAVSQGLGIGALSSWLADRDPNLVRLLPDFTPMVMPFWLVANEDLRRNPRIRRVFDALREALTRRHAPIPAAEAVL
jgi:DNA-binding transcriptional LysR family regulator